MFAIATIFCLNIIIIFCLLRSVQGDCSITYSQKPTFYKYVGSKKLKINTLNDGVLRLHEGQELEAHCNINFELPTYYKNSKIIYLQCKGSNIYTSTDSNHEMNNDYYGGLVEIKCSFSNWNLYESSQNFHWCPTNVTSYILAKPESLHTQTIAYNYLAGVCYDIYNLSLHSIYYSTLATDKIHYAELLPFYHSNDLVSVLLYEPSVEIKYIKETFGSNSISESDVDNEQLVNWITQSNYNFDSIIQHETLYFTFKEQFASLLEFVWWPNLRLYNWKRYTDALEKHIENEKKVYNILAGVSGAVKAPIMQSCQKNYIMQEVVFNTNRQIPLYVWNYLQDSANITNELVIIGFNSPFSEFYHRDNIIFCPSKCHEIYWLKEFSTYFRYNIMGTVFCCTVEDVRSSKRLNGFPENDIRPKPVESLELIETEYE